MIFWLYCANTNTRTSRLQFSLATNQLQKLLVDYSKEQESIFQLKIQFSITIQNDFRLFVLLIFKRWSYYADARTLYDSDFPMNLQMSIKNIPVNRLSR